MSLPLSIAITAQNEENNLRRCLSSIADLASEIVVVDSGSIDGTLAVALGFGAKIHHQKWMGHNEQKKTALSLCSQTWVLVLDCDEVVSSELRTSLLDFFMDGSDQLYSGASMNRLTWFMGRWIRHGDWYPDRKLRLLRLAEASCVGNEVHDKIEVAGNVFVLQGDLFHYSFTDSCHHLFKHIGYADKSAALELTKGRKWSWIEALFRPLWRFFRAYFVRLGFLDGFPGLWIAVATAFFTLVKHGRRYEMTQISNAQRAEKAAASTS
jgi:glycosyltransferase involved in cell wall biosynthesis